MKRLFTVLAIAMISCIVSASHIQFSQITVDNGLSSNTVKTFSRDSYGRLWVGTTNGADLISNGRIREFKSFSIDGHTVIAGDILSIGCASRAIIATDDHILDFDPDMEKCFAVRLNGENLTTDYILMDGEDAYFFCKQNSAMMKYNMNDTAVKIITQFPAEMEYQFSKYFKVPGDDGRILLIEDNQGVFSLDLTNGSISHITQIAKGVKARSAFIDSKGILWVSSHENGIEGFYVNSGFDRIARYTKENSGLFSNNISCMAELPDGNLLVCTSESGAVVIDRKTGKADTDLLEGERISRALCVAVNPHDMEIMFGTVFDGIVNWKRSFMHSISHIEMKEGFTSLNLPISAFQDKDGSVYIGSAGFGLYTFNEDTDENILIPNTDGLRISSICRLDENRLLIADRTSGLFSIDPDRGNLLPFDKFDSYQVTGISDRSAYIRLANTGNGEIMLFNARGRHFKYSPSTGNVEEFFLYIGNDLINKSVVTDVEMTDTYALAAAGNCIYQIDGRTLVARLLVQNPSRSVISSVKEDSQGIIWACTPDGILKFNARTNESQLMLAAGDFGSFLAMESDRQGRMWISTDKALIIMYDPSNGNVLKYTAEDCIANLKFNQYFTLASDRNLIYLPHATGILCIDPEFRTVRNDKSSKLTRTLVSLDGKPLPEKNTAESNGKALSIPNQHSFINVSVATGVFNQTNRIPLRFSLMKDGMTVLEKVTGATELSIPKSTSGTFDLYVSIAEEQGWSEPEKILSYKVSKPFLTSVPALLLLLLVIIGISVTIAKVSTSIKQIELDNRSSQQANEVKDSRLAMFSDTVHDLRTPLSLIMNPVKDIIDENRLAEEDMSRMKKVMGHVQKMTSMLDDLLNRDISEQQADNVQEQPAPAKPARKTKSRPAADAAVETLENEPELPDTIESFDTKSMTMLIVDDQEDILQFIKEEYSSLFKTVYTAHDGLEALDIIRQKMPNVVVSDIMMPKMNGFELCRTIKTNLEMSSIPVILLTSRSDPKNQDMGYKMGADSFLPKPFDSKLLYKIIRSQLKNRYEIKRQYAESLFTSLSENQTFSAADEQFVLKLNRFIRENIAVTDLGVDMIVDYMHCSRTTLFNKMNNMLGATTNKYIRRIRIEMAKDLLEKTDKTMNEIAGETGFSESQYFSTVFKQETGVKPSQYRENFRKKKSEQS